MSVLCPRGFFWRFGLFLRLLWTRSSFWQLRSSIPVLALVFATVPAAYSQEPGQTATVVQSASVTGGGEQIGDRPVSVANLVARQPVSIKQDSTRLPGRGLQILSRAVLYGGSAFDISTTLHGLNNGLREANPLLGQHRASVAVVVIGTTVATDFVAASFARGGHPKMAVVSRLMGGSLHFGAALHNLNLK
jgi:hypothetical protein